MENIKEKIEELIEMLKQKFLDKYEYDVLFDNASFWIKENKKPKVHVSINRNGRKITYFPEDIPLSETVSDDVKQVIELWAENNSIAFVDMNDVYLERLAMMRTTVKKR